MKGISLLADMVATCFVVVRFVLVTIVSTTSVTVFPVLTLHMIGRASVINDIVLHECRLIVPGLLNVQYCEEFYVIVKKTNASGGCLSFSLRAAHLRLQ